MNDFASQALSTGFLRVVAGAIVGLALYRYSLPSSSSLGPVASGRRFFAWFSLTCSITLFGKAVVPPNGEAFILWLISIILWGLVAFLAGLVWGKFRNATGSSKAIRPLDFTPLSSNTEARNILKVRLAKGEISIAEFNSLLAVIDGTPNQSIPLVRPSSPVAATASGTIHDTFGDKGITKVETLSSAPPSKELAPIIIKPPQRPDGFYDEKLAKSVRAMNAALKR